MKWMQRRQQQQQQKIECFHTNSHGYCKSIREKYVCSFIYIALSWARDTRLEKKCGEIVFFLFFFFHNNNFPPRNVNARFTFYIHHKCTQANIRTDNYFALLIFSFVVFIWEEDPLTPYTPYFILWKWDLSLFGLMICLLFPFEMNLSFDYCISCFVV